MGILKIDEALEADARAAAALNGGTAEQQIERWARRGRALEVLDQKRQPDTEAQVMKILMEVAHSADREAVRAQIFASGKPVASFDPAHPELVVLVYPDGRQVYGRMEGKEFKPVADPR